MWVLLVYWRLRVLTRIRPRGILYYNQSKNFYEIVLQNDLLMLEPLKDPL